MTYSCSCCEPSKEYTEKRNLYRHQKLTGCGVDNRKDQKRILYEKNPHKCKMCSNSITYKQIKEVKNKCGNLFCSRSCAIKFNNLTQHWRSKKIVRPKPICINCSNSVKVHQARYCSKKCHSDYQNKIYIETWLGGGVDGGHNGGLCARVRRYLLEQADHKCTKCGWNEINPSTGNSPLNVEHIDGDSTNHSPENLTILCPNCHSLTPTYGALNMGKGREQRRLSRREAKAEGRLVA